MWLKNMLAALLAALLAAASVGAAPAASSAPQSKRTIAFSYGSEKVRGLNIGGWLVLEPWITPSIFQNVDQSLGIVDEYTLTQQLGTAAALEILQPHWDTWCTFDDFAKIAQAGFNTVRIPIGYWAYLLEDGEPYTQGAAVYIDAAIDWARGTGLKIWIDLHGAPGSQNGFDNSGHRLGNPTAPGTPGWQQGDTVQQTLAVLQIITAKYAQPEYQDVISGIELLNEPLSPSLNFADLQQFYMDGFGQLRAQSEYGDMTVVLQDGFAAPSRWNGVLSPDTGAQNVVVDHHEYQVFTPALVAMTPEEHVQYVCTNAPSYTSGVDKWLVIGEWTAAMTDCAPALNGYLIGARYDGSYPGSTYVASCSGLSDISTWSDTFKSQMTAYITAQISTFESQANGWIFWNFKTEAAHEWDAFVLIDNGVFPSLSQTFTPVCS
ncbi:hypothetical protein B7494_g6357 [Chlorociboria aeruginascens]|nr:hypothetical protein B7494_g6357 [Chlorociboria aeruginascens]